jgi:release factor glutamine methyltransferase
MPNIDQILHAIQDIHDQTYAPNDDSFLIIDVLSNLPLHDKKVLDIGTGSGILGLFCAQNGAHVTVTDVDEIILENVSTAASELGLEIKTTKSNMFLTIDGQYDIVLFNPPYLPSNGVEDSTIDGGVHGRMFIDQFFQGLATHLKHDGLALLLVSSLNEPHLIIQKHPEYSITVAARRTLFFEELQALLCRFRGFPSQRLDR